MSHDGGEGVGERALIPGEGEDEFGGESASGFSGSAASCKLN